MRSTNGIRLSAILAALALAGVLVAGCGGDDGDGQSPAAAQTPAERSPESFARQVGRLLAETKGKKDCGALEAINKRSIYEFTCPPVAEVRKSMARFEVLDTGAYGTAAVVDYKSGKARDGASMVLMRHPGGQWMVTRFGLLTESSVGSSDEESRPGFDKVVRRYLRAVEARDCKAYADFAVTSSAEPQTICRLEFPLTQKLATALKESGNPRPRYLGGNDSFGFYGLETDRPKPRYFTISVIKTVPGSLQPFLVLDVADGPVEG